MAARSDNAIVARFRTTDVHKVISRTEAARFIFQQFLHAAFAGLAAIDRDRVEVGGSVFEHPGHLIPDILFPGQALCVQCTSAERTAAVAGTNAAIGIDPKGFGMTVAVDMAYRRSLRLILKRTPHRHSDADCGPTSHGCDHSNNPDREMPD